MKKIIQQEKSQMLCDATGKELLSDYCSVSLQVLAANKDILKECVFEYKQENDIKGKVTKDQEGEATWMAWDLEYIELDLSPEIGYEIFMLLKRKYPKAIKKSLSDNCKIKPFFGLD